MIKTLCDFQFLISLSRLSTIVGANVIYICGCLLIMFTFAYDVSLFLLGSVVSPNLVAGHSDDTTCQCQ